MLTIEVDYLTGCAVATDRQNRSAPEWPPHPQRLFAAFVAAYEECGFGEPERAALEWLEGLAPPHLAYSDAIPRDPVAVYVPVNDVTTPESAPRAIKNGLRALPSHRPRQERFFPTVVPVEALVYFSWPDATEDDLATHRPALESLATEIGYLGHSTSLVRVAVVDEPPPPTLEPSFDPAVPATERLRTVTAGRLSLLEETYRQSIDGLRRIEAPDIPRTRYRPAVGSPASSQNVFGETRDWFVFKRVAGRPLPVESCLALTNSVRRAVCEKCDDSLAALLCGHDPDGTPTRNPHVAFVPLAHVGHRHADGEIHGFAVVLPRGLPYSTRQSVLGRLAELRNVWNDERACDRQHLAFNWRVEMLTGEDRLKTLQPSTYLRRSRQWATVTPVVFGHFLRKLDDSRTQRILTHSCRDIGLPPPIRAEISPVSRLLGTSASSEFPSLSCKGKPVWTAFRARRHQLPRKLNDGTPVRMRYHVALEFAEPVSGPVILGAGRYFGMGLCRPWKWTEEGSE